MGGPCKHSPHPNPRLSDTCVKCGHRLPPMRPRDIALERELVATAAEGVGSDAGGLDAYADFRAHPGGVRPDLDDLTETREEIADARNYLVWGIERHYQAFLDGDPDAARYVTKRMRALGRLVQVWDELRG